MLGQNTQSRGCLTRLIDVVNRAPEELEDLVGFQRGRLALGFSFLILKEMLTVGDFEFFGYTYMSGGKLGTPSNDPAIEAARPKVQADLAQSLDPVSMQQITQKFVDTIQYKGPERYVKIIPTISHDPKLGPADQYPASKLGIKQLNLVKMKWFIDAAKVQGSIWQLADGTYYDARSRPRYDLPYAADSRKRVMDYLENV